MYKWKQGFFLHDKKTGLEIHIREREGYWDWEVFDRYKIFKAEQASSADFAKQQALNYLKGINENI